MVTKQVPEILAASRIANVRYAIRDLAVLADEVAREGHKILYLNIGDPCKFDFPTPPHLIEAVRKSMVDGYNGYADSLGIKPAVESIRAQAERHGFKDIQSIFITFGSGEAIDTCLTALLNPGDNVLTPIPEYPLYSAVLAKLDAVPNGYYLDEANGWQPDLADMEQKINARTKAIILINPNNPTGSMYSKETLEAVAEMARKHNLLLFADEIYDKLLFDPADKHISIATLAPDVPCITFNGLSKAYLAPGWRIGWGIATGPGEVINPFIEGVHRLLRARLSAPHPMQFAVKPALEGPQDHLVVMAEKLRRRRDVTVDWANRTPRVSLVAPKGAFYAHAKLDIPEDDLTFVRDLLTQKHVLVVHGSGFGQQPGTKHIRIVFLPEEPVLKAAYEAMTEFMQTRYA
ncbi:MAG TPA: aminotransferase class I/II-fold pyridoxal phosphate-dependent enzyme [Clostridia bacterium]|nr:aminotransferase class I/II-fold pyridoxal phosphate-dependent enzyme [Clostridia bacterium]